MAAVVLSVAFSWRLPQSTKIIVSLLMRYVKVTGDNPSKDTAQCSALKAFSFIQKIHTSRAQMCRRVGFFGAVVLFLRTVGPPLLPVPPWLPPRNRPLGFSTIHTQYSLRPSSKVWLLCMYCVCNKCTTVISGGLSWGWRWHSRGFAPKEGRGTNLKIKRPESE